MSLFPALDQTINVLSLQTYMCDHIPFSTEGDVDHQTLC